MTVSPDHGPPGTLVRVAAEGLPADADFQLVWRTVKGGWKVAQAEYHGREYTPAAFDYGYSSSSVAFVIEYLRYRYVVHTESRSEET